MTTIYLVRHAQSAHNAHTNKDLPTGSDWGEFESPLSEEGEEQAKKRAESFRAIHFDAVFSSDLTRARRTAEIIASERNMEVQLSKRIRERYYYDYLHSLESSGKSRKEIKDEVKAALQQLDEKDKLKYKHGEGMESDAEAVNRLLTFLREIALANSGKTLLVVNHGGNMRALLTLLGYAKFDELPEDALVNTGYIVLETDGDEFFIKRVDGVVKHKGTVRIF